MISKGVLLFCAAFLILTGGPAIAQEMSISDAYRAIPHKQTTFSPQQSRAPDADAKYLDHYFFAADVAVRAKVMAMRSFYGRKGGMDIIRYNKEIEDLVSSFSLVETPRHLQEVEDLLIGAIRDQQAFFNAWHKTRGTPQFQILGRNYRQHPKVLSAHNKLIQAYYALKQAYPRETQHNQAAFYDHLCALDFI